MPNKQYVSGRSYEYQIMNKHLRPQGYSCTRASGSHGIFDIIAWRKDEIRFIQSKKQNSPNLNPNLYKEDIEQMKNDTNVPLSTDTLKITKELWIFRSRRPLTIIQV